MGRIEIDPSRHRRKIDQKEVKEIIEESKTNFREIVAQQLIFLYLATSTPKQ